jgi:hypothetical protein
MGSFSRAKISVVLFRLAVLHIVESNVLPPELYVSFIEASVLCIQRCLADRLLRLKEGLSHD